MTLPFAEPLHLFSIPNQVLDGLQPRASPLSIVVPDSIEEKPPATTSAPSLNALACTLCIGAVFTDVSDQRLHFRSDWHRYNVKLRLRDNEAEAVDETQFSTLIEGMNLHLHAIRVLSLVQVSRILSPARNRRYRGKRSLPARKIGYLRC